MTKAVVGWDIGGAHVKAVMLTPNGQVCRAVQQPCALWLGLHLLEQVLQEVLQSWQLQTSDCAHAVTMTGELVDLFASRPQGVMAIAQTVLRWMPQAVFYTASAQKIEFTHATEDNAMHIASMNWHASAMAVAQQYAQDTVALVDIGSTTTDITRCAYGNVTPQGWTDAERMAQGSLLYTGVVRTPLMALGPYLRWQGRQQAIAAEYFATTADVYRLLTLLPAQDDMANTADGQDKSVVATQRRLARMVGLDVTDVPTASLVALAQAFQQQQLDLMIQALQRMLAMHTKEAVSTLVGCGAGAFLLPDIAQSLGFAYQSAGAGIRAESASLQQQAVVCYPAYAVAQIWQGYHKSQLKQDSVRSAWL